MSVPSESLCSQYRGSLRAGSYNRAALRTAIELKPPAMTIETADILAFPLYNEDVGAQSFAPPVETMSPQIGVADAPLFVNPGGAEERDRGLRRPPDQPFAGKRVASKHAVVDLTKTADDELARQGIRVNAVCPGPVDTQMIHSLKAQLNPADPANVGRRYQSAIPIGRYVTPDEIANTVLFL